MGIDYTGNGTLTLKVEGEDRERFINEFKKAFEGKSDYKCKCNERGVFKFNCFGRWALMNLFKEFVDSHKDDINEGAVWFSTIDEGVPWMIYFEYCDGELTSQEINRRLPNDWEVYEGCFDR